jgi:electron-transferring-flavoprotein dehydrogenase
MTEPVERDEMEYDVVIVGAGPAGLAAGIRLKQIEAETGQEISVAVLEKGSEVGAHILSGVVMDPKGLDELMPEWREADTKPITTEVTKDKFYFLGPEGGLQLPGLMMPPFMHNDGMFTGSLANVCRWMAEKAEDLGVEVYPGFACAETLYDSEGHVEGVRIGDFGVDEKGNPKDGMYTPGPLIKGKYTLFGEGARGSLSKELITHYKLDEGRDPQKYGIGLKELWRLSKDQHVNGLVQHSFGWPLDNETGGGSFIYHFGEDDRYAAVGFVVHLNYKNPYLSPFDEFQRFKLHPFIRPMFEGGERLAYGARAITEGGFQSVPKLAFPGGALIGCAAGFVNVPRIKGSHNAIKTGMLAAEAAATALQQGRAKDTLSEYEAGYQGSWVYKELKKVRNVKPMWSKFGTVGGVVLGGIDMWANTLIPGGLGYTLSHGKPDHATTVEVTDKRAKPITYPKPDGQITFDKLSSVYLSGTNHEEDQPVHLVLGDKDRPIEHNLVKYAEPARLYCPAAVYEVLYDENGENPRFQINAQNCVHCKTCDIKDPTQNINWVTPEGGGGPVYPNM